MTSRSASVPVWAASCESCASCSGEKWTSIASSLGISSCCINGLTVFKTVLHCDTVGLRKTICASEQQRTYIQLARSSERYESRLQRLRCFATFTQAFLTPADRSIRRGPRLGLGWYESGLWPSKQSATLGKLGMTATFAPCHDCDPVLGERSLLRSAEILQPMSQDRDMRHPAGSWHIFTKSLSEIDDIDFSSGINLHQDVRHDPTLGTPREPVGLPASGQVAVSMLPESLVRRNRRLRRTVEDPVCSPSQSHRFR